MAAAPGPPFLIITTSTAVRDFLLAVCHSSTVHCRLSWALVCSELEDQAGMLPIEIKGGGISTSVVVVVAHSSG
jgi:hypothetical protein